MNKYLKYFLLILCILALVGCSGRAEKNVSDPTGTIAPTITSEVSPSPTADTGYEQISPTTDASFIVFMADTFSADDAKDYKIDWQLLIQYQFNIRIIPFDILSYGKHWSMTNSGINLLAESGENIFSEIAEYRESGAITPYNDFLEDSAAWHSLPESFRHTYRDTDGNIWALPKSDAISVFGRAYNNSWMEALGLKLPDNVNALYEVLNAFANSDPNSNGKNDTYGTAIEKRVTSLITFKDVFEAYGCRLSYSYEPQFRSGRYTVGYTSFPVGYNPESGLIEDFSTSQGMKDSLVFIRGLIDNGIVKLDSNSMAGGYFEAEEYGTQLGLLEDNLINTGKYQYTYSLSNSGEKAVTSIPRADNEAYFLFSKTLDKEIIVPKFVDIFYGTLEGYKMAYTGITGEYFKYEEDPDVADGYVINEQFSKGVTHIDLLGKLSWFDLSVRRPDIDSNMELLDMQDLLGDQRMYVLEPRHMAFLENLEVKPVGGGGTDRYEKDMNALFYEFNKGNISPDDMIAELEKLNAIYDIESLIEETNERWLAGK